MKNKIIKRFIISTFVALYILTSAISTIHVIDFFELSNPRWMAITLAIGFEIGAAASLASLIIMDKINKTLVWSLFIAITLMQINGNLYYAFINMQEYSSWVELFNLLEWEDLEQKRLLAAVSGAILPLIALGFIKSLIDYIKPPEDKLISKDVAGFDDVALDKEDYFEDKEDYFEDKEDYFEDEEPFSNYFEDKEPFSNLTKDELRAAEEALDIWREERLGINNKTKTEVKEPLNNTEDKDIEQLDATLNDKLNDLEEDEDLALEKALEKKAEEKKEEYLKNKNNVKS